MAITLPGDAVTARFPTLGSVINAAMPYVYAIAGLSLLLMLIYGGITLMTAAGDAKKSAEGYGILQMAIIGFVIIFAAFFVAQIVQVVLGIKFL